VVLGSEAGHGGITGGRGGRFQGGRAGAGKLQACSKRSMITASTRKPDTKVLRKRRKNNTSKKRGGFKESLLWETNCPRVRGMKAEGPGDYYAR